VQADGKILVGGEFTTPRNYIGRLNADGTLDSGFNPGPDGNVYSLAVQADGKILVGGYFTTLGGQLCNRIGRLNADGTLDSGFNPGANGGVVSLAVQADGKILVGGGFTTLGGQPRTNIARLNNTEPATQSLSYDGSTITWLRGGTSPEVWRTSFDVSTNGSDWLILGAGSRIPGAWRLMGVTLPPDGTLRARGYVSGGYHNASGWFVEAYYGRPGLTFQPASRTNDAGTTTTFSVVAGGSEPLSFQWRKEGVPLVDGGNLAGATTAVLRLTNVLRGDGGGYSVVVSNGLGSVTSAVANLTVTDPVIIVQPLSQNREPGQSVAFSVTAAGTAPLGYQWWKREVALVDGGNIAGAATAVLRLTNVWGGDDADYRVVVRNQYGSVTSAVAGLRVALGSVDSGFNPGADYDVSSLAVQADGKILVGGSFTNLAGQTRNRIGRLNADGILDGGFNPGANDGVVSLAVQADGKILVGGGFNTLGGQPRIRLGRLNADGSLDSGFNPGATDMVYSLAVQADGKILVGGWFFTLGGQPRTNIARLNADGILDSGFNPGANGSAYSLAVQADGKILVGGRFTTLGGQPRTNIARLNADGILDSGFNPGATGYSVYSLAVQADGKILVGGWFTTLGGQPRENIGRLNNTEPATQSLSCDGSTITWLRGGTSPEVWRTSFDASTNGIHWTSLGAGSRIPGGWRLMGVTLPPDGMIRARGHVTGGRYNGSAWFVESTLSLAREIRLNIALLGSQVVLNWTGGRGPYQVQQTTDLGNPSSWENMGEPVQTNSVSLPVGPGNLFLRVRGQ
jgi:uncharacterized delta-60 repeat protein